MRAIFQRDGDARIRFFYADRFTADPDSIAQDFCQFVDAVSNDIILNLPFPADKIRAAANLNPGLPWPTLEQADLCARLYAAFLASPHR